MQIRAVPLVLIALLTWSLAGGVCAGSGKPAVQPALIDINGSSRAQLQTLPGIGAAEAARIVAGRPYLSKASLVTHHVIPAGVYQAIRNRIIAIQHTMPSHAAAADMRALNRSGAG